MIYDTICGIIVYRTIDIPELPDKIIIFRNEYSYTVWIFGFTFKGVHTRLKEAIHSLIIQYRELKCKGYFNLK